MNMSQQSVQEVSRAKPVVKETLRVREISGDTPEEILADARSKFRSLGFACQRATLPTRCFEVAVALLMIALISPLMLIISWLIRRGSPGPILFRQTRIREGLRPFSFYKFRSFYHDSDTRFPDLFEFDHSDEEVGDFKFKLENDPRMTPQGVWMRSTSLDELPNFWNLLKGDVALVGPRPEIAELLPNYENYMLKKFSVRPGITGLAQTSGRSDLTFLEGIQYDLEYVDKRSFLLDVKILWSTFAKCITREGAR